MIGDVVRAAFALPIAHRGLHASGGPVENTIAAAEAAVRFGYGIECDVRLSRDGRPVVFHDERLARLAGVDAALADLDADALAGMRLHDGSAIPTLAELMRAIDGRVPLVIEIKGDSLALCDAVIADIADRCGVIVLEAFDPAVVARCACAPCPVGLVGPAAAIDSLAAVRSLPRCDFLSWSIDRLEEAAVRWPGVPLSAWTVRTAEQRDRAERQGAQIVFEGMRP